MAATIVIREEVVWATRLRELLTGWGYAGTAAIDGGDALRKIRETIPDLVILDIQMPGLDGFAVLRSLREEDGLIHLPVIALTAFAMDGDREKTLSLGFDGYHSKPLNPRQLKLEIERLLEEPHSAGGVKI